MTTFTKIGYERLGTLDVKVVHALVGPHSHEFYGEQINMNSARYRLFKKNPSCVTCGIEGRFYAVEINAKRSKRRRGEWQSQKGPGRKPHLNFYAVNDKGEEVLMTKDHIIPKSKGGPNHDNNYQTMCSPCNFSKADLVPENQQEPAHGIVSS